MAVMSGEHALAGTRLPVSSKFDKAIDYYLSNAKVKLASGGIKLADVANNRAFQPVRDAIVKNAGETFSKAIGNNPESKVITNPTTGQLTRIDDVVGTFNTAAPALARTIKINKGGEMNPDAMSTRSKVSTLLKTTSQRLDLEANNAHRAGNIDLRDELLDQRAAVDNLHGLLENPLNKERFDAIPDRTTGGVAKAAGKAIGVGIALPALLSSVGVPGWLLDVGLSTVLGVDKFSGGKIGAIKWAKDIFNSLKLSPDQWTRRAMSKVELENPGVSGEPAPQPEGGESFGKTTLLPTPPPGTPTDFGKGGATLSPASTTRIPIWKGKEVTPTEATPVEATKPTETQPTPITPTEPVPVTETKTPIEPIPGKIEQHPDHAKVASDAGVKYEGTKDGHVWFVDPRPGHQDELLVLPEDRFTNSDEVKNYVKEVTETGEKGENNRAIQGVVGNIPEKAAGVGRQPKPSWMPQAEYDEVTHRYPGMNLEEAKQRNDDINELAKAQAKPETAPKELTKPQEKALDEAVKKAEPPKPKTKAPKPIPKEAKTPTTEKAKTTPEEAKAKADAEAAVRRTALDDESKRQFGTTYWSLDEAQQRKVIDAVDKAEAAKPVVQEPVKEETPTLVPPKQEVTGIKEQLKQGTPEATAFVNRFREQHKDTKLTDDQIIKYNNDYGKLELRYPKKGEDAKALADKLNAAIKPDDPNQNHWEVYNTEGSNRTGLRRYKAGVPKNEMNYMPGEEMPNEEMPDKEVSFQEWRDGGYKPEEFFKLPNGWQKQRLAILAHELLGHGASLYLDGVPVKEVSLRVNPEHPERPGGYVIPDYEKLGLEPGKQQAVDNAIKVINALGDSVDSRMVLAKALGGGVSVDKALDAVNPRNEHPGLLGSDRYNFDRLAKAMGMDQTRLDELWEANKKQHADRLQQYQGSFSKLFKALDSPENQSRIKFSGDEVHKILSDITGVKNPFEESKSKKATSAPKAKEKLNTVQNLPQKSLRTRPGNITKEMAKGLAGR